VVVVVLVASVAPVSCGVVLVVIFSTDSFVPNASGILLSAEWAQVQDSRLIVVATFVREPEALPTLHHDDPLDVSTIGPLLEVTATQV